MGAKRACAIDVGLLEQAVRATMPAWAIEAEVGAAQVRVAVAMGQERRGGAAKGAAELGAGGR